MNTRTKFALSLVGFAVLALLCWQTMSGDPVVIHERSFGVDFSIRFRTVTLAILALLAARTTASFLRASAEERRETGSKD